MPNFLKNKKAEIISSQSIKWLIVLLVMAVLIFSYFNSNDSIKSNLDDKIINNLKMEEELCRASTSTCDVKICSENVECTDKEEEKSDLYLTFKEDCDSTSNDKKNELCGGIIYQLISKAQEKIDNSEKPTQGSTSTTYANSQNVVDLNLISSYDRELYKKKLKLNDEFLDKVEDIATSLETKPEYLIAVMNFETGSSFDPCETNSIGATGLIQFTKTTAKNLGTSTTLLCEMTQIEQLEYVYKYLKPYTGKLNSLNDLYMAVFLPVGIGKDENYVLSTNGDKYYTNNKGLDINKDNYITIAETTYLVSKNYNNVIS